MHGRGRSDLSKRRRTRRPRGQKRLSVRGTHGSRPGHPSEHDRLPAPPRRHPHTASAPPRQSVDRNGAFHVAQLANVVVASLDTGPPEEDVTGGLRQPLPGHDALPVIAVTTPAGKPLEHRAEACASLAWRNNGSRSESPRSSTIASSVPTLPTPTTGRAGPGYAACTGCSDSSESSNPASSIATDGASPSGGAR